MCIHEYTAYMHTYIHKCIHTSTSICSYKVPQIAKKIVNRALLSTLIAKYMKRTYMHAYININLNTRHTCTQTYIHTCIHTHNTTHFQLQSAPNGQEKSQQGSSFHSDNQVHEAHKLQGSCCTGTPGWQTHRREVSSNGYVCLY